MRFIRSKQNPLIIKAFGCVGPGGLGEFDPQKYEEVEGALPEGYQIEVPLIDLWTRLNRIMTQEWLDRAIAGQVATPPQAMQILDLQSKIRMACDFNSPHLAKAAIEVSFVDGVDISDLKTKLLNEVDK